MTPTTHPARRVPATLHTGLLVSTGRAFAGAAERTGTSRAGGGQPSAPVAGRALAGVAAAVMLALALTSGRYGYHRDELYFIAAGEHPAWGYPDQPLLTPLLANAMQQLVPGSLLVLRLPAILMGGLTTVVSGLLAREFGGGPRAQLLAAASWGVGAVCLVTGHFLTTTTGDVCATAVVSLLIARLLRTGDLRLWLPAGLVLGVGLLNKSLIAAVVALVVLFIALLGPRRALRSRWLIAGAALAVLGGLPYGLWQLAHGLPQEALARSIENQGAEGGRAGVIPFELVLIGPLLTPLWVAGLLALLREPRLRAQRCFGAAYLTLIPLLILSGGKSYYLAGLLPVLLAAGAVGGERWLERRHSRIRLAALTAAILGTAAINAVVGLAVLPVDELQGSVVMALNPDSGEMVGWPRFTDTVAAVYHSLPAGERQHAVIFTSNYGEAGAIAHFGPARGLPYPYSGHNGWSFWGPPAAAETAVVAVGLDRREAREYFTGCALRARLNDGVGLDNQEQGEPIWACTGEREPWARLWPRLRHYD